MDDTGVQEDRCDEAERMSDPQLQPISNLTDRNHWLGSLLSKPPNAQIDSREQVLSGGFAVLFKPDGTVSGTVLDYGGDVQGSSIAKGTPCTCFMHSGKRAPNEMSALVEGPSMGLMYG